MKNHPLVLFNSVGRELQEFVPIDETHVRMYSCGLTVYNYAHIGNLRAYVFTDTLRRVLQWKRYNVTHVINITDVGHLTSDADEGDDKMELAAQKKGQTVWDIAEYYTQEFNKDLEFLHVLEPSVWCKATDHIQEMIGFAQKIEEQGFAYQLEDGLYLDTAKVTEYGRLALLDLEGQQEGARVQTQEGKRQASDFAIWRRSPTDQQRLMEWHSPWGVGAPGWHLECSAMSIKYLGSRFDIHTGGIDHRQVHHCNEIAQNEAFLGEGTSAVNFWLHNEFLTFSREKMSKSKGDFLRLKTLGEWGLAPQSYRYFLLMSTYRRPLEFSFDAVASAQHGLSRLLGRLEALKEQSTGDLGWIDLLEEAKFSRGGSFGYIIDTVAEPLSETAKEWLERFDEALAQDLNTAKALGVLSTLLDEDLPPGEVLRLAGILDLALGLQLLTTSPAELARRPIASSLEAVDVERLIEERQTARAERNFQRADEIRKQLDDNGVLIKDSQVGTTWDWMPMAPTVE